MTEARPSVSFVVPVRNGSARLASCLRSLEQTRQQAIEIEIIVADAASTDDSRDIASRFGARLLTLGRVNAARARNEAAHIARSDVLAFVDADHEVDRNWALTALALLVDANVAAVGAPYSAPADSTWVQRSYESLRRSGSDTGATRWLASGNLAVRRSAFRQVGGFDESLETCEDVDLSYRLRRHGHRLVSDPRLRSVHHGDPRSLRALFLGELWRGRDNLTVSLRYPITPRDLPGIVLPLLVLAGVAALPAGLATWSLGGRWLVLAAGGILGGAVLCRAAVLVGRRQRSFSPLTFVQALLVAGAYDLGRALALVGRVGHDARREA